ncbi:MAG: ubiquitin-activating E1 FCCH domain-containing protein [bacterium]
MRPAWLLLFSLPALAAITNVSVQPTHRQAVISYTAPTAAACTVEVYASDLRVTAAMNTSPVRVTVHRPHSLETGDKVYISGVLGNTAANGYHTVTVVDDTSFTLNGVAGNGAYTSGGLVQRLVHDLNPRIFGPGVGLDSRAGSISNLRQRQFVAGQIPLPGWPGYAASETTSIPVSIASISRASNVATVDTAAPHGLRVNDNVAIAGVEDGTFETIDARVTAVVDANTFRYASPGIDGSSTGGTVTRVNRYSRALQADTDHRFRITCGADTYDGTFRTRTVPLGSTYGEVGAFDWQSAPMRYLDPSLPETRGYEVVDPVTGVMALRASLDADSSDPVSSFDAGNMSGCASEKTATGVGGTPGYHCLTVTQGRTNRIYWHGEDGTVRFLGVPRVAASAEWDTFYITDPQIYPDSADPNKFFVVYPDRTSGKAGLALATLLSDAAVAQGAFANLTAVSLTPAAAGKAIVDLIEDFDPTFPKFQFSAVSLASVQDNYLTGWTRARGQDSPTWYWALYLGDRLPLGSCSDCLRIVAAMPLHANPKTRWCGGHYSNFIAPDNVIGIITQKLTGGTATGPWQVTLQNEGGVSADAQGFTVDGEPDCTGGTCPTDNSTYLQDAAVGDVFMFLDGTNEKVKITAKAGTAWTVMRGYANTKAAAHAAGAKLRAVCECIEVDAKVDYFWKYLEDPHGTDTTNTHFIQDTHMQNIHRVERGEWTIGAGWMMRGGTTYSGPPTYTLEASRTFAGVIGFASGNSYQKHPSYANYAAPEEWRRGWFIDTMPFIGSIAPGDTVSSVAGTSYIVKSVPSASYPRNFKKAPYFGLSARNVLLDVSGPGALLKDSPEDHYKFCAVYKAGECWPGSVPGEAYANLPSLNVASCFGGESETNTADFCAFHTAAYGQGIAQLAIAPNGAAHSRMLIRGLAGPWRNWGSLTNARTTPDGKWLLFTPRLRAERVGLWQALVPDNPASDDVNRSDFVPFPVRLAGRPGATRTVLEFGYDPDLQWRCSQRAEACVVDSTTYDTAAPYKFATTDAVAGADCSNGCTLTIPAIADRILYYRWKYRDANGNVLATGPVRIAAITP